MKLIGNSQGTGLAGAHSGLRIVQRCAIKGCWDLAAFGEKYCVACREEIADLHAWHALHDGRESRAAMAFFHACSAVRRRLWIPLTLFVVVALVVMGAAWGPAAVEWLGAW